MEDFIRPLFRSAVPSRLITSDFNNSVDATLLDIFNTLNGSNINLTRTLQDYFLAISNVYFDEAISLPEFSSLSLNDIQRNCGVRTVFRHIHTNTNASAELVDLFQNISQAIRIIKRVCTYVSMYVCSVYVHTYIHTYMYYYYMMFIAYTYIPYSGKLIFTAKLKTL